MRLSLALRAVALWAGIVAFATFAFFATRPQSPPTAIDPVRSDHFWTMLFIRGLEAEQYDDLPSMTVASDRVVVAEIKSVELGRQIGESYPMSFVVVTLGVSETLQGTHSDELRLEVMLPDADKLAQLQGNLPQELAIFFLRDKSAEGRALGLPATDIKADEGFFRLVSSQGVLRDLNGRVGIPIENEDAFLLQLSGEAFGSIKNDVDGYAKG